MSAPLHLLRPFARWTRRGKLVTAVDAAAEYVMDVSASGRTEFFTATSRPLRRHSEMEGGSVYFVRSGVALFRMPFLRCEENSAMARFFQGKHLIVMRPELIRVQPHPPVGLVRGWRYIEDDRVPPDVVVDNNAGLPGNFPAEIGLSS